MTFQIFLHVRGSATIKICTEQSLLQIMRSRLIIRNLLCNWSIIVTAFFFSRANPWLEAQKCLNCVTCFRGLQLYFMPDCRNSHRWESRKNSMIAARVNVFFFLSIHSIAARYTKKKSWLSQDANFDAIFRNNNMNKKLSRSTPGPYRESSIIVRQRWCFEITETD